MRPVDAGRRRPGLGALSPVGEGEVRRFLRFVTVGLVNTAVDLGVFAALLAVHPLGPVAHDPWRGALYAVLAWGMAALVGHRMHSRFTFRTYLPRFGFYGVTAGCVGFQMAMAAAGTAAGGDAGALVGKVVGVGLSGVFAYTGYRWLASPGAPGPDAVVLPTSASDAEGATS